jgi:hypothetical protein
VKWALPAYLSREQLSQLQSDNALQTASNEVTFTNENGVPEARFNMETPGVALLICAQ